VFVGFYEAAAIIRRSIMRSQRGPTHESSKRLPWLDLEVKHVIISAMFLENTFCATLILQQKFPDGKPSGRGTVTRYESTPGPATCFVIALQNKVDVFVTEEVFEQVQDVSEEWPKRQRGLGRGPVADLWETWEFDLRAGVEGESDEAREAENPFLEAEESDEALPAKKQPTRTQPTRTLPTRTLPTRTLAGENTAGDEGDEDGNEDEVRG